MKTRLLLVAAIVALTLVPAGPSGGARQLRVAFVTDVLSLSDPHDFRALAYRGYLRAVNDFHLQGRVLGGDPKQGLAHSLALLARRGYDLVVLVEVNTSADFEPVARVIKQFPKTKFVISDLRYEQFGRPANLQGSIWRVEQPSYLAGYLAALMEKARPGPGVVGSVSGFEIPNIVPFIAGFEAGARSADPGIKVLRGFSKDFLNPAKCKAVARSQIARGAGVVFNVAGLCGRGTLAVAKQSRVWAVGVDVDQSYLGPEVLTSVLKHWDVQVYRSIEAFVHGKLETGRNEIWDLSNGAVGLGKISPDIPVAIRRQLGRVSVRIESGAIKVTTKLRQP
jgi:basic membrane protein A